MCWKLKKKLGVKIVHQQMHFNATGMIFGPSGKKYRNNLQGVTYQQLYIAHNQVSFVPTINLSKKLPLFLMLTTLLSSYQ